MNCLEFESHVCYITRPLLNDDEHAGFFGNSGTLFAACSKETADNIFDRLNFRSTLPIKLERLTSDKTLLMVF